MNFLPLVLVAVTTTAPDPVVKSNSSSFLSRNVSPQLAQELHPAYPKLAQLQLTDLSVLKTAFQRRQSNLQVLVLGRVIAVLPDDNNGDRHQRFIIRLANAQTLLVAHNIDQAPRVSNLKVGDQLYIYGEYEWSNKGGTLHWTHRDRNRRHVDGWIQKNGVTFQ